MSLLFDKPITSYFPRVHKEVHKENRSVHKRKRSAERQCDNALDGGKGVEREKRRKPLRDARLKDTGSIAVGDETPTRPSSSEVSPTSGVKHTRTFLKTPPPTDPPKKRRKLQQTPQTLSSASPFERFDYKAVASLPTPLTVARLPRTGPPVHSDVVLYTPCNRFSVENLNTAQINKDIVDYEVKPDESPRQRSHSVIPSSQSQYQDADGFQNLLNGILSPDFCPSPTLHPINRGAGIAPWNLSLPGIDAAAELIDTDAVGSSQSQPLLTNRGYFGNALSRSSIVDFVPSSQSQEKELTVGTSISIIIPTRSLQIEKDGVTSKSTIRKPYRRAANLPQRTASDDLFCVPIQETNFSDIFQDDESHSVAITDETALTGLPPVPQDVDESCTESESEFEVEGPTAASYRFGSIHESFACDATQERETSGALDGSVDNMSSTESLPSAVKDFQGMFGNDEESYPADFPMSLR